MPLPVLTAAQQELIGILRTIYSQNGVRSQRIIRFLYRQPESERPALMADVICWWGLLPTDLDLKDDTELSIGEEEMTITIDLLNSMLKSGQLSSADDFPGGDAPLEAGLRMWRQLAALAEQNEAVQAVWLDNVFQHSDDIPYLRHVKVRQSRPAVSSQTIANAVSEDPRLLAELEYVINQGKSAGNVHPLADWLLNLPDRVGDRDTACHFIRYALVILVRSSRPHVHLVPLKGHHAPGTGGDGPMTPEGPPDRKKDN